MCLSSDNLSLAVISALLKKPNIHMVFEIPEHVGIPGVPDLPLLL